MPQDICLDSVPDYNIKPQRFKHECDANLLNPILNKNKPQETWFWRKNYYSVGPKGIELINLIQKICQAIKGFFGFTDWTSIARVNLEMMKRCDEATSKGFLNDDDIQKILDKLNEPAQASVKEYLQKNTLADKRQYLMAYYQAHVDQFKACYWYKNKGDLDSTEIKAFGDGTLRLARQATQTFRYEEAFKYLQEAWALNHTDPVFQKKLGDEVYRFFESCRKDYLSEEQLDFVLNWVKDAIERNDIQNAEKLVKLMRSFLITHQRERVLCEIGEYYIGKGLTTQSEILSYLEPLYNKYVKNSDKKALLVIGDISWNHNEIRGALQSYQKCVNSFEKEEKAEIYAKIGDCYFRLNDPNKAVEYYGKVISLNPSDIQLYNRVCYQTIDILMDCSGKCLKQKSPEKSIEFQKTAISWYDVLLQKNQYSADKIVIYKEKAQLCDSIGDAYWNTRPPNYDEAFKYYNAASTAFNAARADDEGKVDLVYRQKVISKYIARGNVILNLAEQHLNQKCYEDAAKLYESAISWFEGILPKDPSNEAKVSIYKGKAIACHMIGEFYWNKLVGAIVQKGYLNLITSTIPDYDMALKYYNDAAKAYDAAKANDKDKLDKEYRKKVVKKYIECGNAITDKKLYYCEQSYKQYPEVIGEHYRFLLNHYLQAKKLHEAHILYCRLYKCGQATAVDAFAVGKLLESHPSQIIAAVMSYSEAVSFERNNTSYVDAYNRARTKMAEMLKDPDTAIKHYRDSLKDKESMSDTVLQQIEMSLVKTCREEAEKHYKQNNVKQAIDYLQIAAKEVKRDSLRQDVKKSLLDICAEEAAKCIKSAYLFQTLADYDESEVSEHLTKHQDAIKSAMDYYNLAIEIDPNNARFHFDKAELCDLIGRGGSLTHLEQSLEEYRLAKDLNGNNPFYHYRYFEQLDIMDREAEAEKMKKEFSQGKGWFIFRTKKPLNYLGFADAYMRWYDHCRFQTSEIYDIDPHTYVG